MKDILFLNLAQNCLSRFDFNKLSPQQLWFLLNAYNKKYIEYLVEYGGVFDLYVNNYHQIYKNIFYSSNLDVVSKNTIESYTLYSQNCNSLFSHAQIEPSDIQVFLELVKLGCFSFVPSDEALPFAELFYTAQSDRLVPCELEHSYQREDLNHYPIFLHIPSKLDLDLSQCLNHFADKNPKKWRFIQATKLAIKNSRNLKNMNDVYAILILLDAVIVKFSALIQRGMQDPESSVFFQFLDLIDSTEDQQRLSNRAYEERLTFSKINAVVGWLFPLVPNKKQDRIAFLKVITSGRKNHVQIMQYLMKMAQSENKD